MATVEITTENFKETIDQNNIVLIDYWAAWCGPCRMFSPIFEKVSEAHPDVTFGKCDTEKQGALAAAFQIRSIPTLMAFKDGVLVFSQPGMLPEAALEQLIDKVKTLDMENIKKEIEEKETVAN